MAKIIERLVQEDTDLVILPIGSVVTLEQE
jgi:hypothetical protein